MLKKDAIKELIKNGENSGVEFKQDVLRPEQFAKEIVAFSNFKGGMILLGVEDNGQISGITQANLEEWVFNVCAEKIHPRVIPYYEEVQMDNKAVGVVTVDMGVSKPYVLRHKNREEIYIRVGSTSRLATREEQLQLFQTSGMLHLELIPIPKSEFKDLDIRRVEDYFDRIRKLTPLPTLEKEWIELLENMEFLVKLKDTGNFVCTLLGLLLFARTPRKFLPQAGLTWATFDKTEKDYDAIDRATIDKPLVGLWNKGGELVEEGVLEFTMSKLRQYASHEQLSDNFLTRIVRWDLPPEALREAIINAFAHRDWSRSTDIEATLYKDRLEIISPGPLPNHVTVPRMKQGLRVPRNPILVQILRDYGYVEHMGMGIRNKIIRSMQEHHKREPEFIAEEDRLILKLWK